MNSLKIIFSLSGHPNYGQSVADARAMMSRMRWSLQESERCVRKSHLEIQGLQIRNEGDLNDRKFGFFVIKLKAPKHKALSKDDVKREARITEVVTLYDRLRELSAVLDTFWDCLLEGLDAGAAPHGVSRQVLPMFLCLGVALLNGSTRLQATSNRACPYPSENSVSPIRYLRLSNTFNGLMDEFLPQLERYTLQLEVLQLLLHYANSVSPDDELAEHASISPYSSLAGRARSLAIPGMHLLSALAGCGDSTLSQTITIMSRPPVPFDCRRIKWQCHCGTELYADYPDTDPEMVVKLSEQLNVTAVQSSGNTNCTPAQQNSGTAPDPTHQPTIASAASPSNHAGTSNAQNTGFLSPGGSTSMTSSQHIGGHCPVPKYLELCANTGSLRQSLREIDVTRFTGDIELFHWVRKSYAEMRGWRMRKYFCLRPKSIRFVYFGLEQKEKVHILCKDESYPPESEIKAERYHYAPCPLRPEGAMPMPSDTFIHYLHYCKLDVEVMRAQRTWLDRLPKKVREPLTIAANSAGGSTLVEGWGVHVIEGIDRTAVLWTTVLVLIVSLVPLLGSYIVLTGDVQSATGIASVVLGVVALLWMCMQIEVGRNT